MKIKAMIASSIACLFLSFTIAQADYPAASSVQCMALDNISTALALYSQNYSILMRWVANGNSNGICGYLGTLKGQADTIERFVRPDIATASLFSNGMFRYRVNELQRKTNDALRFCNIGRNPTGVGSLAVLQSDLEIYNLALNAVLIADEISRLKSEQHCQAQP